MDLIDCHTHCYPAEVATDPRAWAAEHREPHWADLVAPVEQASIQGWATRGRMLAAMDEAGVAQAVLLGWYWENETTCRRHNEIIAEWIAHAPERFIGFAAIHPHGDVVDQLEAARALGLCGVGELHFGVQGFDELSPGWERLAAWCVEHDWPVNLHATEAAGHEHPGSVPTPLNTFVRMAATAPDLTIILAHWGGGLPFFEQNPRLRNILKNVVYDTAASPLLYEPEIFRRVVDLVGPHKILFGSDYPLRLFPRKQKMPDIQTFLQRIRDRGGLDSGQWKAVGGGNARRLIPGAIP